MSLTVFSICRLGGWLGVWQEQEQHEPSPAVQEKGGRLTPLPN